MPKWTNKGHEFDELGNYFKENSKITLIGSKEYIENTKAKLNFLNIPIFSIVPLPERKSLHGIKKIIDKIDYHFKKKKYQKNILNLSKKSSIIVVEDANFYLLKEKMLKLGLKENINFFNHTSFFNKYLSIFAVYTKDKVYFPSNSFICTTVCTLNCKDCLNFAPYDKNKQHYDIKRLKRDVDTYFKCVDRVGLFHISGGEPFSYPNLIELIEYIGKNYRNKIDDLAVVTNMTLLPSDELCKTFVKNKVHVQLDDYTETSPERKAQYAKVLNKLKSFNVYYEEIIAGTKWNWVNVFPPKKIEHSEEELIKKYNCCGSVFQELKNGKLFGCCYCEFIAQAKVFDFKEDDYFDLTNFEKERKKELIEFRLKFNNKGYVEFCKFCNGLPPYNKVFIKPAEQAKGFLEWNINNPTEVKKVDNKND